MSSGTKAHAQREETKKQAKINKFIDLNINRTALLTAVADYMHIKYGDDSFYNNHPLTIAILQSAKGGIIDLPKLAADVTSYQPTIAYQPPEAE